MVYALLVQLSYTILHVSYSSIRQLEYVSSLTQPTALSCNFEVYANSVYLNEIHNTCIQAIRLLTFLKLAINQRLHCNN